MYSLPLLWETNLLMTKKVRFKYRSHTLLADRCQKMGWWGHGACPPPQHPPMPWGACLSKLPHTAALQWPLGPMRLLWRLSVQAQSQKGSVCSDGPSPGPRSYPRRDTDEKKEGQGRVVIRALLRGEEEGDTSCQQQEWGGNITPTAVDITKLTWAHHE